MADRDIHSFTCKPTLAFVPTAGHARDVQQRNPVQMRPVCTLLVPRSGGRAAQVWPSGLEQILPLQQR